jgi:hypothetical protein
MPEPKFPKGALVKVNNRDIRNLVWYPKLEQLHGQTGTVVDSEFWSTYFLPGDREPSDVYNYTVQFGADEHENIPQTILLAADKK